MNDYRAVAEIPSINTLYIILNEGRSFLFISGVWSDTGKKVGDWPTYIEQYDDD